MCSKKNCKRHELWGGLCLPHLEEAIENAKRADEDAPVETKETKKK